MPDHREPPARPPDPDRPHPGGAAEGSRLKLHSSSQLVEQARLGDPRALDALCARYLPRLQEWASGRLPSWARSLLDTGDMVQEVLLRSIHHLDGFEQRPGSGFHAYLRQSMKNRIRDEIRRAGRRPVTGDVPAGLADPTPSPLELAIGADVMERYEQALQRLRPEDQEAIVARVELGLSYEELARALDKPSSDAARVAVGRALVRLAREMGHES